MPEAPRRGSMSASDAAQAEDACGMLSGLDPSLSVRRGSVSGRRASMSRAPLVDANHNMQPIMRCIDTSRCALRTLSISRPVVGRARAPVYKQQQTSSQCVHSASSTVA